MDLMISLVPHLQTLAATNSCSKGSFLGLESWFHYLPSGDFDSNCVIKNLNPDHFLGSHSELLLIGLAILDDLVRIAALVAVGYVIYGGIQYVTSQGSPDATGKAQQTIINALIGVVLATLAASIVNLIGSHLGGLS